MAFMSKLSQESFMNNLCTTHLKLYEEINNTHVYMVISLISCSYLLAEGYISSSVIL